MAQRYDIGTLQPPKKRADGSIVLDAHLTRGGVFTYRNPDGTERREYRPDSEVFSKQSLSTFAMVPVTNDHPPEMVSAKNARQYAVGATGSDVRQDGDHVAAQIVVFDEAVITAMSNGKRDVSCGYECDLVEKPGVSPSGERYDAMQTNIVGNHLAIVSTGRAGSARVRMDAGFMTAVVDEQPVNTRQARTDGDSMNLEQALAALAAANEKIGAERVRADAAEKQLTAVTAKLDVATARADSLTEELTAEKKARKDAVDAGPAKVRARVELETKAAPIMGKEFKMDSLDDRAIQVAVIKQVTNVDIDDKKSVDYVSARFDAAIERAATSTEVFQSANAIIVGNTQAKTDAGEVAKAKSHAQSKALYIEPK